MSFRIYINNLDNGDYHIGFFEGDEGKYIRTVERFKFAKILSTLEIFVNDDVPISRKILEDILKECYSKIINLIPNNVYNLEGINGRIEFIYEPGFGDSVENLIVELKETIDLLIKKGRDIKLNS